MPWNLQRSCDAAALSDEWDIVAATILARAMKSNVLGGDQKVAALTFIRAGMFGRRSSYLEHRLSGYRPPIVPGVSSPAVPGWRPLLPRQR
jgi:hypothetical protein